LVRIELHTEVEEVIRAEDVPGFVVKRIDLGGIKLHTPVRTIYTSTEIPLTIRSEILKLEDKKETLLEVNRTIYETRSYAALKEAVKWRDDEAVKRILRVNDKLGEEKVVMPISFSTFPNKELEDRFDGFLDYIHSFSYPILVPHVRFSRTPLKTAIKYDAKSFTKYVDSVVDALNKWNTKPIFVPLDVDYDEPTRNEIINHYAKNGYTNIWIDFKGQVFSPSKISKVRGILRTMEKAFKSQIRQVIVYMANIRKIPRGILGDVKITPSDVLGPFVYGDIVGAPWKGIVWNYQDPDNENYWEKKGFSSEEEYQEALFKRDCSIFDNGSYYYWHPDIVRIEDRKLEHLRETLIDLGPVYRTRAEKLSNAINGIINLRELGIIKGIAENEGTISGYLTERKFFQEEGKGILEKLSIKSKKPKKDNKIRKLFDFMKNVK